MLSRNVPRRPRALRFATRPGNRSFSMPSTAAPSNVNAAIGMLAPFTNELDRIAPCFRMKGSQIQILKTPAEFYETLKDKIGKAERRIFLSTLYIGRCEKELMAILREALGAKAELKLSILTDALRGTRESPEPSCASLLAPLVAEFGPERVEIRMYHTPNLAGFRKRHVPRRINEGWGLQHMKLYGFDDEIILSGANLSTDYFTNRQDRYHVFASKEMTEYYLSLHDAVASRSFLVQPSNAPSGFGLSWPEINAGPSPLQDPKRFIAKSTELLSPIISPRPVASTGDRPACAPEPDTSVYMLAQLSQLLCPDCSTELPAISHLLRTLASPLHAESSWTFTAGYFNPAPSLTRLLLSTASSGNTVITASPYANGFYRSAGISGLLPDAYTLLAHRFLRASHARGRDTDIVLKEWRKGTVGTPGGWTYHAKGFWIRLPGHSAPSISLVGSSNYTRRSYSLDLEVGALIVTENEELKRGLDEEQRRLQDHARVVTREDLASTERRVGWKVRMAMAIVRLVGGAL